MRRPRPSSWPRCCVVGSNWESLGEGVGHFGVGGAQPRARPGEGLGGGQERIRRSHLWVRPALASHPRPGGQRTSVDVRGWERARLSGSSSHETRTPDPEKAFRPGPPASPREGHSIPSVSRRFPTLFPQKAPPAAWGMLVATACVGSWLLGCKTGSIIPYPF